MTGGSRALAPAGGHWQPSLAPALVQSHLSLHLCRPSAGSFLQLETFLPAKRLQVIAGIYYQVHGLVKRSSCFPSAVQVPCKC